MTVEMFSAKEALRTIIDDFATLSDEKRIAEVMGLFTPDAIYMVYMGGALISEVHGTDKLQQDFNGHAAQVKTYFTMNGQHTVSIEGETARGTSFSQLKMVREVEGKDNITDYSVKYVDDYVLQNGRWLISKRVGHFIIIESRPMNG
jgi:ketosteroid isomerase-like protein